MNSLLVPDNIQQATKLEKKIESDQTRKNNLKSRRGPVGSLTNLTDVVTNNDVIW